MIPGGTQEGAALPQNSEEGALPCWQQRKGHKGRQLGKVGKVGAMSRAGGSSPAESQRESRDAGRAALLQKQLREHLGF